MDDCQLLLLNRCFMYAWFSKAFCDEPDETLLDMLASEHMADEVDLVEDGHSDEMRGALADARARLLANDVSRLRDEYTRVFVGPGTLEAYPWESMHTTGKRVLFLPEVLDVRESYRQAGFIPARYPAVSDDFIGLEFDFMGKLAHEAYAHADDGDMEACKIRLRQSEEFLRAHLLQWIDSFCRAIEEHYGACFYADVAKLASIYMRRDAVLLTSLISSMDERD